MKKIQIFEDFEENDELFQFYKTRKGECIIMQI